MKITLRKKCTFTNVPGVLISAGDIKYMFFVEKRERDVAKSYACRFMYISSLIVNVCRRPRSSFPVLYYTIPYLEINTCSRMADFY